MEFGCLPGQVRLELTNNLSLHMSNKKFTRPCSQALEGRCKSVKQSLRLMANLTCLQLAKRLAHVWVKLMWWQVFDILPHFQKELPIGRQPWVGEVSSKWILRCHLTMCDRCAPST